MNRSHRASGKDYIITNAVRILKGKGLALIPAAGENIILPIKDFNREMEIHTKAYKEIESWESPRREVELMKLRHETAMKMREYAKDEYWNNLPSAYKNIICKIDLPPVITTPVKENKFDEKQFLKERAEIEKETKQHYFESVVPQITEPLAKSIAQKLDIANAYSEAFDEMKYRNRTAKPEAITKTAKKQEAVQKLNQLLQQKETSSNQSSPSNQSQENKQP